MGPQIQAGGMPHALVFEGASMNLGAPTRLARMFRAWLSILPLRDDNGRAAVWMILVDPKALMSMPL